MRSLTLARAAGAGLLLAVIALSVLYVIPSNKYYVFLPDRAHPLEPLVSISGEHPAPQKGGVYFVDVRFRKAHLLEDLLGRPLARGATLLPVRDVLGDATAKQQQRIDLTQMEDSQRIAAAVALRRLGYYLRTRMPNVIVRGVLRKAPADRVLRPGDKLLAVNSSPVHSLCGLHTLIASHRPGDPLRTTYSRSGRLETATIRTIASPDDRRQAAIGILVDETGGSIGKLPIKVRIDTQGVGGPSAGLAFALDLTEELGHDVDRGYKVAATGELALDGCVLPIGAVKQKTIGAREAGVDVFLVPAGSNARVARRYAHGLRIIPVQSFPTALFREPRKVRKVPRTAP
ncbi:MAG: PDZ domain-containing protein [Actinobacteria bacterium]|nr:MAG: PDZ domain-containing protein [Actinomycetota bacterium]